MSFFSRLKKKQNEGGKASSYSKTEKSFETLTGTAIEGEGAYMTSSTDQESGLSGVSLFSGLRIMPSSETATAVESPSSSISNQHGAVEDEVSTVGESQFSFISQSSEHSSYEVEMTSKRDGVDVLAEQAAIESGSTSRDVSSADRVISHVAEFEAAQVEVGIKTDDSDIKGHSSPGQTGRRRKKKLRAKRPGQLKENEEQSETRSQEEEKTETLVVVDEDHNERIMHVTNEGMERDRNCDVGDAELGAGSTKPFLSSVSVNNDCDKPTSLSVEVGENEASLVGPGKAMQETDSTASIHSESEGDKPCSQLDSQTVEKSSESVAVLKTEDTDRMSSHVLEVPLNNSLCNVGKDAGTDEAASAVNVEEETLTKTEHDDNDVAHDGEKQSSCYVIELSISEKLALAIQMTKSQLEDIRQQWNSVYNDQRDKVMNARQRHQLKLEVCQQIHDVCQQQTVAVLEENYEKADELNSQMDSLTAQLSSLSNEPFGHLDEMHDHFATLCECEMSLRKDLINKLTIVKEEELQVLSQFKQESAAVITKERQRLNIDRDRMQRQQSHLQLDKDHYEKGEALLEKEIEDKTIELMTAKKRFIGLRDGIRAEIGELEAQLVLLRSREAEYTSLIAVEDEKIDAIKQEMAVERERLDNQKAQIDEKQVQLNVEMDELCDSQNTFELMVEEAKEKETKYVSDIQSVVLLVEDCESRVHQLVSQGQLVERILMQRRLVREENEELSSLLAAERDSYEQLQSLTSKVLDEQVQASKLRKRLKDVEESLPGIQEAKKLAAAGRNFKEASRLAKEATALGEQQQTVSRELSQLEKVLEGNDETLSSLRLQHDSDKQEVSRKQREIDVKLMQEAVDRAVVLRHHITRFQSHKDLFFCFIFESEVSHCEAIAQELSVKHELAVPESSCQLEDVSVDEGGKNSIAMTVNDGLSLDLDNEDELQERTEERKEFDVTATDSKVSGEGQTGGDGVSDENSAVHERIAELEKQIETAVRNEDYDKAAALDEDIQKLKSTL